jgi:hypothetical protein
MTKPNIIGLSAQLQNGKDTVAALIIKLTDKSSMPTFRFNGDEKVPVYHSEWNTRRFAGKLKEMAAILLGCNVLDFEDDNFKNKELGEEWRRWYFVNRAINPDGRVTPYFGSFEDAASFWEENLRDVENIACTNEILTPRKVLQLLGTEGGRDVIHPNIWVNSTLGDITKNDKVIITDARFPNEVEGIKKRNGIVLRIVRPSKVSTSTHPSETSLNNYKDWDYVIVNDGTLEELEEKVKQMLIHFNLL